jgi:probable rRNA maturation factor
MIHLKIFKQSSTRLPRRQIEKLFEEVLETEIGKDAAGDVNLILTDDKRIRELNKRFRKKDKATDVLSFNIESTRKRKYMMGEIYISVETARRQAVEFDTKPSHEVMRLFCHGLLHLIGYDHIKKSERMIMEKKERHFLKLGKKF